MGKEEIFNYVMETPGNTNPNVLRSLLNNSGDLPPVTPSDNGKVLTVENGAWAAGSVSVNLYAALTVTADGYTISVDSQAEGENPTMDEIIDAMYDGLSFNCRFRILSNYIRTVVYPMQEDSGVITFVGYAYDGNEGKLNINFTAYEDDGNLVFSGAITKSKYIVTLTPTDLDYSGTMDKTPQEITTAYNAGMDIVFDIPAMAAKVDADQYLNDNGIIRCGAKVFYDFHAVPVLITIVTSGVSDDQTYATDIYSLTPAS